MVAEGANASRAGVASISSLARQGNPSGSVVFLKRPLVARSSKRSLCAMLEGYARAEEDIPIIVIGSATSPN